MICFDPIHDTEDDVGNPPKHREQPKKRKEKEENGRRPIRSVWSGRIVKDSGKNGDKEKKESAKKESHVTELPDQRLQGMEFHESRVLLDAKNDQRRDEASKHLKQMRKKGHAALVLRGLGQRGKFWLICNGLPSGGLLYGSLNSLPRQLEAAPVCAIRE
jgi:hypothetical protein